MNSAILIVDDEESICLNLQTYFKAKGFVVHTANSGYAALELFKETPIDLALIDLRLPDMSGLEVLEKIKSLSPTTAVIIITAYGDVETAVKAMQMQANNFILKPIDLSALHAMVIANIENYRSRNEISVLKRKLSMLQGSRNLESLRQPLGVYHAIKLLAENSTTNALILGETGTGKGMVAHTIHEMSKRRSGPFVDINCAGLRGELLESELFGHEAGAFTDAKTMKRGLFELANGGSIFLDEISEMAMQVQAKLLKFIETKTFRRLGGTANIVVDVRILTATNTDLEKAIKDGGFRKDLFFRLSVMPITLPPLRERRSDILPLANTFLDEFKKLFVKNISGFSPQADAMLNNYSWPGNIRELRNVIERAVLLCEGNRIEGAYLHDNMKTKSSTAVISEFDAGDNSLENLEKKHISHILNLCENNHSKAAKLLGIHRSTLIKKIAKYGLD